MRVKKRRLATALVLIVASSVFGVVTPGMAYAAQVPMQEIWPATGRANGYTTALNGNMTVGCRPGSADLTTYDQTGAVVQQIDQTQTVDGDANCVTFPAVDENGVVYGRLLNNLVAYNGNSLKWKYPVQCSTSGIAVGGDGNIYTTITESDGTHVIGVTPTVATGQTQPTKVFDVKIDGGCGVSLLPYKYGIIVRDWTVQRYYYYSYAGKFLGQPVGTGFYAKQNADGRLFTYIDTLPRVFRAFEPGQTTASWEYPVTSQSSVHTFFPLRGGGAVLKVDDSSSSPTVNKLVVLDKNGQVVRTVVPSGGIYRVTVDEDGNAVILQGRSVANGGGIAIRLFDLSNGAQVGDEHVLTGYEFSPDPVDSVWITDDTVMFQTLCGSSPNCTPWTPQVLSARINGIGYDYPRGDVITANTSAQPTPIEYVAMGDSFSSGEGVEPFEAGTASPGVNECHRSEKAYARILSRDPASALELSDDGFVACSGAVTDDITEGDDPQFDRVTANTDLITITIGGNDMHFSAFAYACVAPIQDSCEEGPYDDAIARIANDVIPNIEDMLGDLEAHLDTLNGDATVLVLGYPQMVPATWEMSEPGCGWLTPQKVPAIRDVTATLNTAIKNEVDAIGGNFHFVSVTSSGSPFLGHELCRNNSDTIPEFFNNENYAAPDVYTFHPNEQGQRAYADIVKDWLAQHPLN